MKKMLIFRRYAWTILISACAALAIDAAVNFDEYRQAFNKGRGHTEAYARTNDRPTVPSIVAKLGETVFTLIFGDR